MIIDALVLHGLSMSKSFIVAEYWLAEQYL